MTTHVELYFDIVSPYSFVAYEVLKRYERPWQLEITLKPAYLGGVMAGSGNQPPIMVPNRGRWMSGDLRRTCEYYEIDLQMPAEFPVQTLPAMRFLRVLAAERPELLKPATEAFYATMFGTKEGNVSDPSTYAVILKDLGIEESRLTTWMVAMGSDANKQRLKQEAAQLVEDGCFGFPWCNWRQDGGRTITTFGSDRFENVAHALGKTWEGPHPGRTSKL